MDPLERLATSLTELRPSPPRHRQSQLQALHGALAGASAPLTAALSADRPRHTSTEIEAEYCLSLDAVRHFYDGVDVDAERDQEYGVVKGRSCPERRVGVGIVVVRPGGHTRLFNIVVALAGAVAGGNCVVLELPRGESALDDLLKDLLTQAMDGNTFLVTNDQITDHEILARATIVSQTGPNTTTTVPPTNQLLSSPKTRVVAVVDRTADIEAAARAITGARFAFGGASPYAPDLVLVNEFVKRAFFEACSRYATGAFAARRVALERSSEDDEVTRVVKEAEGKKEVVSFGSDEFKLVEVLDRNSPVTRLKITGRYLPIAACSSLVDAVFSQDIETTLLAGYFFADPSSAKYLAQYLPAHKSFINHIPTQLLLGPAAPISHHPDLSYRYTRDMFTLPRPQFVSPPVKSEVLSAAEKLVLEGPSTSVSAQTVRALALKPLKPTGQPKTLEGLDHFASGLFLGGGIVLAVVVPTLGWTSYVLGKGVFGYLSRLRR